MTRPAAHSPATGSRSATPHSSRSRTPTTTYSRTSTR
nr:MAG TPA: hypothetical protein [Caudoviricetes sp.]